MLVARDIKELAALRGPVALAIGMFDGLHLGHRQVIGKAQELARENSGHAVVMTFDPHPMSVIRKSGPPRLTGVQHQLHFLREMGLSAVLIQSFDEEFAALDGESFVHQLLAHIPQLHSINVGHDWSFGQGRKGNVALLEAMGQRYGFAVNPVSPSLRNGEVISSSLIRLHIQKGELKEARKLLGRDYSVYGEVVYGQQIGRTIGFPTANLHLPNQLLPQSGVYAVRARVDNEEGAWKEPVLSGVANIGVRPTVHSGLNEHRLEVHLDQFSGDLYGQYLEVSFISLIRGEKKFPSLEDLKAQIFQDKITANTLLARQPSDAI